MLSGYTGIIETIVLILFFFHTDTCEVLSDLLVPFTFSVRKSCKEIWGSAWCSAYIGSQLYVLFILCSTGLYTFSRNITCDRCQLCIVGSSTVQHVCIWYKISSRYLIWYICQTYCICTTQSMYTYSKFVCWSGFMTSTNLTDQVRSPEKLQGKQFQVEKGTCTYSSAMIYICLSKTVK